MNKNISRRDFIKAAAVSGLGVAAASVLGGCAKKPEGIYTPGTYSATAQGMGKITVTATFDTEKITKVELDLPQETPSIGQAAAEELINQIMDTQSADIDGVAGATVTAKGVAKAMKDCIAQAKGETVVSVSEEGNGTKEVTDWLGKEPETPDCDTTIETETLIVGCGNGGTMCGAYLAKLGKTNFVMTEKLPTNGDTRHWYGAIGSKYAKETGTTVDVNRLKREVSRYASGKNSKEVLNTWINESAQMADFIDEVYAELQPDNTCTFAYV